MLVGPLIGANRPALDVSRHGVVGQDEVPVDVAVALTRVEQPPGPRVANEVHHRQRVRQLCAVVLRILGIEVVRLPVVAVGEVVVGVENEVPVAERVELEREDDRPEKAVLLPFR